MENVLDLHCHTIASDGAMAPLALVQRAAERGVTTLAITDHDTVAACRWLARQDDLPLRLVNGIEFSCTWSRQEVHVVALDFSLEDPVLQQALAHQQEARANRAEIIATRLARAGMPDALAGAIEVLNRARMEADPDFARDCQEAVPGRPHFAQWMVEQGYVKDRAHAFRRYLGAGKPGNVRSQWPSLQQVLEWTGGMGAIAVLAHPLKYRMTNTKLRALIKDFVAHGGQGMEVSCGSLPADGLYYSARLCSEYGLLASQGSDFHGPINPWIDLGKTPPLPSECTPVWSRFRSDRQSMS